MVVINDNICFSMKKLRKHFSDDIKNFINRALEHYLNEEEIKKIAENTGEYVKEKLLEDNFIYLTMDDNLCTYKYRRGKKDGNYCCKKITKNGNKHKYVCTRHNPDHIPKKRKNKNFKNSKNCKIFENNKNINNLVFKLKNDKNKILKKKLKKNRKIFICSSGLLNFKKIFDNIL